MIKDTVCDITVRLYTYPLVFASLYRRHPAQSPGFAIRARLCSVIPRSSYCKPVGRRRGGGLFRSPAHGLRALRLRLPSWLSFAAWPSRCSCCTACSSGAAGRCAPPGGLFGYQIEPGTDTLDIWKRPGLVGPRVPLGPAQRSACELSRSRPTARSHAAIPADSTRRASQNESARWVAIFSVLVKPTPRRSLRTARRLAGSATKTTSSASGPRPESRATPLQARPCCCGRLTRRHTGGTRRRPEGRAPHRCGWPST